MATFISMLRGINVSGQKKTKMNELKAVYETLKFRNVTTYIQSGNVIFDCPTTDAFKLSKSIEQKIEKELGYPVSVLIREKSDLKQVINNNPFLNRRNINVSKLYVTFLSNNPSTIQLNEIHGEKSGKDECLSIGKEMFLYCPNGYGKTKLSNNFFEKKLGVAAATRNWKTVNKLYEIAAGL